MLTLALAALVAAAPSQKPKLLVLDLRPGAGVDPSVTGPMTEAVAAEVARRGYFEIVSQRDLTTLLGLEREKQLLGCSDTNSTCMAELSGALGARFTLSGSVARLGDAYQLTLTTLDSEKAQPLGRAIRLAQQLGTLQAQLPFAVAEATATPLPPPPSRVLPYSLMGVGAGAIIFGGVWGIVAISSEGQLNGELEAGKSGALSQTLTQYNARADAILQNKIIALSTLGAGVAVLAVGLLINPGDAQGGGSLALVPTANGFALVGALR